MTDLIKVDGAQGEGGGQIVRSSVALALVTGRPVQIDNIRACRNKPGLMRQHLTALRAAAEIGHADVEGAEIGSASLLFRSYVINPGSHKFAVGTAGSATLVLQTVLPALLSAEERSELVLEGGTHNPWAPPYDFLAKAYFPLVERSGPRFTSHLHRHGFYPAGGGRFTVEIEPARELQGMELLERGDIVKRSAMSLIANLPGQVGTREIEGLSKKLNWLSECFHVCKIANSQGPGNVLLVEIESEHATEVFTGFGRFGIKAEHVADDVLKQVRGYLATNAPVGPFLADQLLLPLAITAWRYGNGSHRFTGRRATGSSGGWFDRRRPRPGISSARWW